MLNGRKRRGLFAVPVNVYLLIALVAVVAIIHVTWLPRLPVRPDLMLVLVVAWSLLRGIEEGLLWAFIGGVLLDLLSVGPFGGFTVGLLLAALIGGIVHRTVFTSGVFWPAVTMIATTLLFHPIYLAILNVAGFSAPWSAVSGVIVPLLVWNVALLLLLLPPLSWLHRRTAPTPVGM
ncbi:MAG: rod shape-determining protein MreD [Anaerolineae bacterium]